ncbi:MAG: SUMF1/EgtB/PvdO family nonheme iron enzyme [Anaerolineales bacterium]|nr:SUMF1/EgtB/PvdO family nonheme iron enzyme [Anaerolineales bacterium]
MSQPSWIGYNLGGRYKIEALLGQGGMSAVYRAYDPNLRRTVAVKLIHSHLTSDTEFVRRFEAEAAAVAQLRHPSIVQVFDFDHDGDTYYMIMEYVPGETLQARLKTLSQTKQRFPMVATASIIATVADAVAYAHDRGTIHRDLKPANIMLMPGDQPVLTDFGVAKILGGQQHTATGAIIGTPAYMAPEQVRGEPLDGRADIYSLGIVLYEMAAGRPPFEGDSAMTVMLKHVNEAVPDIRSRAEVPPALTEVLDRVLAKQPAQRYQTAGEFAAALRMIAQRPYSTGKSDTVVPNQPPPVGATIIEPARPPATNAAQRPMATIRENIPVGAPPPVYSGSAPVPPAAHTGAVPVPASAAAIPAPAAPARRGPSGLLVGGVVGLLGLCLLAAIVVGAILGGPTLLAMLAGATATTSAGSQATNTAGPAEATQVAGAPSATPAAAQPTAEVEPTVAPTEVVEVKDTDVPPTAVPTDTPAPAVVVPPDGMLLIPEGKFGMGSGNGDAGPAHTVVLSQFFMDKTEATNARYQACLDAGACSIHPRASFTRGSYATSETFAQFPVVNVTWEQAVAMCQFEGKRLPTEAEWEYAATGGDGRRFPWGNDFDAALVPAAAGDTLAVASLPGGASPFGLYDMSGNVLEWVSDWYALDYYGVSPVDNPQGPETGSQKVMRGGSFGNADPFLYLTTRRYIRNPGGADVDIGFRCAQSVP